MTFWILFLLFNMKKILKLNLRTMESTMIFGILEKRKEKNLKKYYIKLDGFSDRQSKEAGLNPGTTVRIKH